MIFRVQARFGIRMHLTSANVEEVIQKRLLKKRNSSEDQLKLVYERESSNFDTLFGFADGSVALNNFSSEQHFINSYPSFRISTHCSARQSRGFPITTPLKADMPQLASGLCSAFSKTLPRNF